jgi:hypothetical protein
MLTSIYRRSSGERGARVRRLLAYGHGDYERCEGTRKKDSSCPAARRHAAGGLGEFGLGVTAMSRADQSRPRPTFKNHCASFREIVDDSAWPGLPSVWDGALMRGDVNRAMETFEESLTVAPGLGTDRCLHNALQLAQVSSSRGGPRAIRKPFEEGITLSEQVTDAQTSPTALEGLAAGCGGTRRRSARRAFSARRRVCWRSSELPSIPTTNRILPVRTHCICHTFAAGRRSLRGGS